MTTKLPRYVARAAAAASGRKRVSRKILPGFPPCERFLPWDVRFRRAFLDGVLAAQQKPDRWFESARRGLQLRSRAATKFRCRRRETFPRGLRSARRDSLHERRF